MALDPGVTTSRPLVVRDSGGATVAPDADPSVEVFVDGVSVGLATVAALPGTGEFLATFAPAGTSGQSCSLRIRTTVNTVPVVSEKFVGFLGFDRTVEQTGTPYIPVSIRSAGILTQADATPSVSVYRGTIPAPGIAVTVTPVASDPGLYIANWTQPGGWAMGDAVIARVDAVLGGQPVNSATFVAEITEGCSNCSSTWAQAIRDAMALAPSPGLVPAEGSIDQMVSAPTQRALMSEFSEPGPI